MRNLPLKGLRVLDMSRVLAGPWCTMLLGDAGADVIKLERLLTGDDTRSWGPPFVGPQVSTYFLSVNRSKRSIAVDIKKQQGLDICHRLATEWADVLVENFTTGTMERLGLGYDSLSDKNPGLVYCSINGFGSTGPYASRPGYDVIVSGMYGLMDITGEEEGPPVKVGVAQTDLLTGTLANSGILSALYEREKTGVGKRVEVSLMETQLAGLVNIASSTLNSSPNDDEPKRWGTAHASIVPYQAFKCEASSDDDDDDQYVIVGAGNDEQFVKFCNVLQLPELSSDARFATNANRVANRSILVPILQERFAQKSRDEWVKELEGKGFPLGPLRPVSEAFKCPQASHREVVQTLVHPAVGEIKLPKTPIFFPTEDPIEDCDQVLPPPMLGEHTDAILTDLLDFNSTEIADLEDNGVIECWQLDD